MSTTTVSTPVHTTETASGEIPVKSHPQSATMQMATQHLAKGELPPNALIHSELNQTAEYLAERERLNPNEKHSTVLRDVRELVEVANHTLAEKNRNDLAQRFVDDVTLVLGKKTLGNVNSGDDYLGYSQKFIESLRNILLASVKSPNFRRIVIDLLRIVRDLFGDLEVGNVHSAFINSGTSSHISATAAAKESVTAHVQNIREGNVTFTEESKARTRADVRELLAELNAHPDSRESIKHFLALWSMISTEFYANADRSRADPDITRVYLEGRQMVEAYTGGRTLDNFLIRLRNVVGIIERDRELYVYLQQIQNHLLAAVNNPTLIESDEYFRQADGLYERGRLFANVYRSDPEVQAFLNEAFIISEAMRSDPSLVALGAKASALMSNVTYTDREGRRHLDSELLPLVRNELVPFLISRVKEVPVKGFQVNNEDFEYLIVDDLFITIDEILPDHVRIHTENDTRLAVQGDGHSGSKTYLDITIDGVRVSVKDFYFSFKKKKVITLKDEGRADLKLAGDGVFIRIRYELSSDSKTGFTGLSHAHVEARVDRVEFNILAAKHKKSLNLISGLFKSQIQRQVSTGLQDKIAQYSVELAELLNRTVFANIAPTKLASMVKGGLGGGKSPRHGGHSPRHGKTGHSPRHGEHGKTHVNVDKHGHPITNPNPGVPLSSGPIHTHPVDPHTGHPVQHHTTGHTQLPGAIHPTEAPHHHIPPAGGHGEHPTAALPHGQTQFPTGGHNQHSTGHTGHSTTGHGHGVTQTPTGLPVHQTSATHGDPTFNDATVGSHGSTHGSTHGH